MNLIARHTKSNLKFFKAIEYYLSMVVFLILILCSTEVTAQSYLKSNEQVLISFNTINRKLLIVAMDNSKKYIIYRYGTNKRIEFEYPKDSQNSFSKFKWFYYIRNGGPQNAGVEIYQLQFTNDNYTYKIYQQSLAETSGFLNTIGIIIVNNKTHQTTTFKGIPKSQKGNLNLLEDVPEIELSKEAF